MCNELKCQHDRTKGNGTEVLMPSLNPSTPPTIVVDLRGGGGGVKGAIQPSPTVSLLYIIPI